MKKIFFLSSFCLTIWSLAAQDVAAEEGSGRFKDRPPQPRYEGPRIDWSNPEAIPDETLATHFYKWTGLPDEVSVSELKGKLPMGGNGALGNLTVVNHRDARSKIYSLDSNAVLTLKRCTLTERRTGTAHGTAKCEFDNGVELHIKH